MKFLLILTFSAIFISQFNYAQDSVQLERKIMECGHSRAQHHLLQRNPEYRFLFQQAQKQLSEDRAKYLAEKNEIREGTVYTIPVVFHILHNDGPEKISIAQCKSAIDKMNRDFSASNSDVNDVVDAFKGKQANCEIQFRLATKAPDGTCFPGVTYTKSSKTEGDVAWVNGYDQVHAILEGNNVYQGYWGGSNYMHVFVCKSLTIKGAAAYTSLPWTTDMSSHIYSLHQRIGTIGTAAGVSDGTTMSHEVGHWLNLHHPWGPTNDPELTSNCSTDDDVKDTPLCIGVLSCKLKMNSCSGDNSYWGFDQIDNVENFMDYSHCSKMFTEGQKDRMRAALNSSVGGRNQLWKESNLQKVGAVDDPQLCSAFFESNNKQVCAGQSIEFTDQSFNGQVVKWSWSFEGGTPSTSNDQNPVVTYSSPGDYNVTLVVEDASGNQYDNTETNYITVLSTDGAKGSFHEGFESISSFVNSRWTIESANEINWEVFSSTAFSGSKCARLKARSGSGFGAEWNAKDFDLMTSPHLDLSEYSKGTLSFKYAHVQSVDSLRDKLRIQFSKDCGETWSTKKLLSSKLITADIQTGNFTPKPEHWDSTSITISESFCSSNFMFRLKYESGGGNNAYLDDINIFLENSISIEERKEYLKLKIYPNPAKESVSLLFENIPSSTISINLFDSQGRIIDEIARNLSPREHISFPISQYAKGLYILETRIGETIEHSKLLLQ